MKVDTTNLRDVLFDCPWEGHAYGEGGIMVRNSTRPDVVGMQCMKCGALIYEQVKVPAPAPTMGLVQPHPSLEVMGAPVLVTDSREDGN